MKWDKKTQLARLLYHTGVTGLFQQVALRPGLFVLNYHRLRPDDMGWATLFDDGVFNNTVSDFEGQMLWVRKYCQVLSENDLLEHIQRDSIPSKPAVLITFDDGYVDNFSLAYPILKSYDLPAIFFIPSLLIDSRRLGWWDIITYLVNCCPRPEVVFGKNRFELPSEKSWLKKVLLNRMKNEPWSTTEGLLSEVARICEVEPPDGTIQDAELMNWDQIREVTANGISIGSHTHTHRVLATLDIDSQRLEMHQSKKLLEEKTGVKVRSIAYPVGGPEHFTKETVDLADVCGYQLGFSAMNSGMNVWRKFYPLCVRRLSFPMDDVRTLSAQIVFPNLFFRRNRGNI